MRAPIVVAVALAAIISGPTLAEEGYVVGITGALTGAGQNAMPPPMLLRGPFVKALDPVRTPDIDFSH